MNDPFLLGTLACLVLLYRWPRVATLLLCCGMGWLAYREAVEGTALRAVCVLAFTAVLAALPFAFTVPSLQRKA